MQANTATLFNGHESELDSPLNDKASCKTAGLALSNRQFFWAILFLVVCGSVMQFANLGSYRTLAMHESYVAVPAREMVQSGDWLIPRFGNIPRLQKPPLGYWAVAATSVLSGELTEATVRFPAAVSSLLLAALVGFWTGRWYGRTAGLVAAFAQATSVYVFIHSRRGEVDMLLSLLIVSAMFLVADSKADEPRRIAFLRRTLIYTLLGLSVLGKYHYGPVMVLFPCCLYLVVQRRYRCLLNLLNPLGLAIFATLTFSWPILVLQELPNAWTIWRSETIGRALGELQPDPNRTSMFYFLTLIWLTLPWCPFALGVTRAQWRGA